MARTTSSMTSWQNFALRYEVHNLRRRSAAAFLENISHVCRYGNADEEIQKFFKTADGKRKALEKMTETDRRSGKERKEKSTVKLQEMRLHGDYMSASRAFLTASRRIIRAYTHRDSKTQEVRQAYRMDRRLCTNLINMRRFPDIENLPGPPICSEKVLKQFKL